MALRLIACAAETRSPDSDFQFGIDDDDRLLLAVSSRPGVSG